jgi:hypothetical protein
VPEKKSLAKFALSKFSTKPWIGNIFLLWLAIVTVVPTVRKRLPARRLSHICPFCHWIWNRSYAREIAVRVSAWPAGERAGHASLGLHRLRPRPHARRLVNGALVCVPDHRRQESAPRPAYDAAEGQRLKDRAWLEMVADLEGSWKR